MEGWLKKKVGKTKKTEEEEAVEKWKVVKNVSHEQGIWRTAFGVQQNNHDVWPYKSFSLSHCKEESNREAKYKVIRSDKQYCTLWNTVVLDH